MPVTAAVDAFRRRRADPRENPMGAFSYGNKLRDDLSRFEAEGGEIGPTQYAGAPFMGGGGATSSLRRAAPSTSAFDGPDPVTAYQQQRANYEQGQSDRQDETIARQRASDPGIQLYEDQRRRERVSGDVAASDKIAEDSYLRREPLTRMQDYDAEARARRMLPYNPAVIQSEYKREGVLDTNDARRDAAGAAAGARTGSAAINALARAGSAQTFGDPAAEARVGGAIDAIRPNVPGQSPGAGGKTISATDFEDFVAQRFNGNRRAAEEAIRQHGYTIGGGG